MENLYVPDHNYEFDGETYTYTDSTTGKIHHQVLLKLAPK